MTLFHRPPYQFEAHQWKGDNLEELRAFTGVRIAPSTGADINIFNPIGTFLPDHLYNDCDPKPTAELWDGAAKHWVPVTVGEWILPNDGEFHTCTDEFMQINFIELTPEMTALIAEEERPKTFFEDLTRLLNHHSKEVASGTPDWILANFLSNVLWQFDCAVASRAKWRGESVELPALQELREGQDVEFQTNSIAKTDVYDDELKNLGPIKNPKTFVEMADQDGKEVPLVLYTDGKRNEIGTAKVQVTPGEVRVEGTIVAANAILGEPIPEGQYSIDVKPAQAEDLGGTVFDKYLRRGLNQ